MIACRLYALAFHNPDLLFSQPVKLVDQRIYLPVGGIDLPLEGDLVMGRAGLLELLMEGEH